jgi:hypothetical protein
MDAAEKGLRLLPDNRILLYWSGYSRSRLAKEFLAGLHPGKAEKELIEARKKLERAIKTSEQLDVRERTLNGDIYRALVLVCEMSSDIRSMKHFFDLWRKEHPDDPDAESEWGRVSRKYGIQSNKK